MKNGKSKQSETQKRREVDIKDILRGIELKKIEMQTLVERGVELLHQSSSREEKERMFKIVSEKEQALGGPSDFTHEICFLCWHAADLSIKARAK